MDTKVNVSQAKQKKVSKAKANAKKVVEKLHQMVLDVGPVAAPSELMMVPVELVDIEDQVRTEFYEASIQELAGDIARRGLLQPVLLRPGVDGRFVLISGERRIRACKVAGLSSVPALLRTVDESAAEIMQVQLAENFQREDLSLKDSAKAVRQIYDLCGSVTETGLIIGKSKAWTSKHLKVTCGNLRYEVGWLLDNGQCEDLEVLLGLNTLFEKDYLTGVDQLEKYKKGEAGRQTIRDALGNIEAIIQERERTNEVFEAERVAFRAEAIAKRQEQVKINEAQRLKDIEEEYDAHPDRYLRAIEIDEFRYSDGKSLAVVLEEMTEGRMASITRHLELMHISGTGASYEHLVKMIGQKRHALSEITGYLMGMLGKPFDVMAIIVTAEEGLRSGEDS